VPPYEFSFEARPELGTAALKCLLWRRGGIAGPIALVLFPVVLFLLALDARYRLAAAVCGGAALMLLFIFLIAVAHRRRLRRQFFANASHRTVSVRIDADGLALKSALGESTLPWAVIERVWRCREVALIFHHGWQYMAMPAAAVPPGALDYAESRSRFGSRRM
jgi:hypothetical protein